jgi:D-alanyl-D-alanine endopeptidase (penicillin-binding protein 7)
MKNSEKLTFLFVVIVLAFFARALYPSVSAAPQEATADQSEIAAQQSGAPLVSLPQTSAIDSANIASVPAPQNTTSSTSSTDSFFSKIGSAPVPNFSNEAYMVADLTSGAVLSGSNTNNRWPTASLTKLMTATIVMDTLPTSTEITITPEMFTADPTEATLVVGDTYTVEDLLHLLLMPSSNVAAEAMADFVGRAKFMQEMNMRAQEWGMQNTYFDDPSGISAANESTANDLLTLAQHVYNNYPEVLAITDTPVTTITELNSGKKITVHSINVFAGEPIFIGGKTGNTPQAGGNLLSIFNYQGKPVFITVLGAPALPFEDTSMLYTWFRTNFT